MSTDPATTNVPDAPGETDGSVSTQSAITDRERFTQPGGPVAGSANEMVRSIQAVEAPDNSQAPSEKIALYVNVAQDNPSPANPDGSVSVTRDLVGEEVDTEVRVAGRGWAEHVETEADSPGSTTVGIELQDINATGTVDKNPLHSGPNSHINMRIMADGNAPSTAAVVVGQGAQPFEEGVVFAPGAIVAGHDAIDDRSGNIELGKGTNVVLDPGAAIIATLASGRQVVVGYINADGWLVLGGPDVPNIVAWSENKQAYVSLTN